MAFWDILSKQANAGPNDSGSKKTPVVSKTPAPTTPASAEGFWASLVPKTPVAPVRTSPISLMPTAPTSVAKTTQAFIPKAASKTPAPTIASIPVPAREKSVTDPKVIMARQETLSAAPERSKISQLFENNAPKVVKDVINDIRQAVVGSGQGVDIAGNPVENSGFVGFFRPFGVGKTDFARVDDRYTKLIESGVTPERATQIATQYARTSVKDPLLAKKDEVSRDKALASLNLTPTEKTALRKVGFLEGVDQVLGSLDFVGIGSIEKVTAKLIAEETSKLPIKNLLMKEIPNITDDLADEAARYLTTLNDEYAVEKFLNKLDFSVNKIGDAEIGTVRSASTVDAEPITIKEKLKSKYPDIDLSIYEKDDEINLSKIIVPKSSRNAGMGTDAMNQIVKYADKTNKKITLTPSSDYGGSKSRLTEFYKRFGFVENKGKNKDFSTRESMYRSPMTMTENRAVADETSDIVRTYDDGTPIERPAALAKRATNDLTEGEVAALIKEGKDIRAKLATAEPKAREVMVSRIVQIRQKLRQNDAIKRSVLERTRKAAEPAPEKPVEKPVEPKPAPESKVGPVQQAFMILTPEKGERAIIERGIKELKRVTAQTAADKKLEVKLSEDLRQRATDLAIRKDEIDNNPLKNLVKYMARSGQFQGRLPEVTGEVGKGRFARTGDQIITEAAGIDDVEKARDAFEKYIASRKKFEKDIAAFQKDKQAFLKEERAKRDQIIEDRKVGRSIEKNQRDIDKALDEESKKKAKIEKITKKEQETQERLKKEDETKSKYEKMVEKAHLDDAQKRSMLAKFKSYFSPIEQTDATTKRIYLDWETAKLKAKESGNDIYEKYKAMKNNDLPSIMDYEAGSNTPWIREVFDDLFTEAKRADINFNYKENYIPHVYRETPEQIQRAVAEFIKDQNLPPKVLEDFNKTGEVPEKLAIRLKTHPFFEKIRTFPNYKTAMQYGLTPRFNTVAEHIAFYKEELGKIVANRNLIDNLIKEGKILDAFDAPESWVEVKLPGRMRRTYYADPNLADALNGQFRDEDNLTFMQEFHRRLNATAGLLQDITLTGGVPGTTINNFAIGQAIRMLTTGIGEVAKLNLPGASTSVKAAMSFLRANFNGATLKFFKDNHKYIDLMVENNVPIVRRLNDYEQSYKTWSSLISKQSLRDALKGFKTTSAAIKDATGIKAKAGAALEVFDTRAIGVPKDIYDKALSDKTFLNMMPQMQIQVFKDVYERALKAGMPEATAGEFAGKMVRTEFGVINDLGRTKNVKDVMGSYFFAPRFREGMINVFVNGAKAWTTQIKNPTFARSRSLILGMIVSYIVYNYINQQLNDGDNMWENEKGREFALKIPLPNGKIIYTEFMPSSLAFLRNMGSGAIAAAKGDSKTATQKFGTLFSIPIKLTTEIASNSDYFGRKIYEETDPIAMRVKKVALYAGLGTTHPYIREIARFLQGQQNIYQTMSMMAELPLKFSNEEKAALSRYYEEQAEKTKLNARERTKIVDTIETYDKVQKLKQQGKMDEAGAIVDDLSDSEYQEYQTIMKYDQIVALKAKKKTATVNKLVDALSEEEYLQYLAIKSIRTSQKRTATTEKKAGVAPKYDDGDRIPQRGLIESVVTYAQAIGTDPVTAFNRIFSNQYIRRVDNGAIIVERLPLLESQKIKEEQGGNTPEMKLDHTLPLQLGGSNDIDNLKLVPTEVWKTYTPVENHLGKLLRAGKISDEEARRLITSFKAGKIPASDIMGL